MKGKNKFNFPWEIGTLLNCTSKKNIQKGTHIRGIGMQKKRKTFLLKVVEIKVYKSLLFLLVLMCHFVCAKAKQKLFPHLCLLLTAIRRMLGNIFFYFHYFGIHTSIYLMELLRLFFCSSMWIRKVFIKWYWIDVLHYYDWLTVKGNILDWKLL